MHIRMVTLLLFSLLLGACGSFSTSEEHQQPVEASAILKLADKAMQGGDWALAANLYQKAAMEQENSSQAFTGLAQSLAQIGKWPEAAEAYEKAIVLDPKNNDLRTSLANLYILLLKPERAEKHLLAALNQKPSPKLFNSYGITQDLLSRQKEAQQAYYSGLVLDGDDLSLRTNLGLSLAFAGQKKEAVKILQKVTSHPGAKIKHRQNLALAYILSGQDKLAEKMLRMDFNDGQAAKLLEFYRGIAKLKQPGEKIAALIRGIPEKQ